LKNILRAIYYDTETTGVQSKRDRVIELAAFDPERNATFSELINPECPIPPDATAIHNITDEMVKNSPTFAEILPKFLTFCEGEVALVAHNNAGFDRHFMAAEFERAGEELPSWPMVDTLKWARRYRPDLPRHTLQFLRETYGFAANQAHRALDDVKILHQVAMAMWDDLSITTVIQLLERQHAITHMPFGKHRGKPLAEVPKDYLQWLKSSGALDKPQNAELKEALPL